MSCSYSNNFHSNIDNSRLNPRADSIMLADEPFVVILSSLGVVLFSSGVVVSSMGVVVSSLGVVVENVLQCGSS